MALKSQRKGEFRGDDYWAGWGGGVRSRGPEIARSISRGGEGDANAFGKK